MPVTLADIAAALTAHGQSRPLAARSRPYVPDVQMGYVTNILSPTTAFIASMVVYHEDSDLAFERIATADVTAAATALADAEAAHRDARRDNTDVTTALATLNTARASNSRAQHRQLIRNNLENHVAMNGYVDLVGCQQTAPLSAPNVFQYFKMLRLSERDDDLLEYIMYWAISNPGIKDLPSFSERVEAVEWVAYHSGASSNAPLLMSARDTAPIADFFTDAEIAAAQASANAPGNMTLARSIPKNALVKTYAVLEAYSALPENTWYMGKKAKEAYPVAKYSLLVKVIRAHQARLTIEHTGDEDTPIATMEANIRALIAGMDRSGGTAIVPHGPHGPVANPNAGGGGDGGDGGTDDDDDDDPHQGPFNYRDGEEEEEDNNMDTHGAKSGSSGESSISGGSRSDSDGNSDDDDDEDGEERMSAKKEMPEKQKRKDEQMDEGHDLEDGEVLPQENTQSPQGAISNRLRRKRNMDDGAGGSRKKRATGKKGNSGQK